LPDPANSDYRQQAWNVFPRKPITETEIDREEERPRGRTAT